MPRGDGTGPLGVGPRTGRKAGTRTGCGANPGRDMMGGRGAGPAEECVCPRCGEKTPHQPGIPCLQQKCPKCGSPMVRN